MPTLTPAALASRHLRYSLVRGVYLLPLLSNAVMCYIGWEGHWPRQLEIDWLTPLAFITLTLLYGSVGTLIGIVILGIPAAAFGLLRLLPMRGLFHLSIGRPSGLIPKCWPALFFFLKQVCW